MENKQQQIQIGSTILLNGGQFIVTALNNNDIELQRTTEPKLKLEGELSGEQIKLSHWINSQPFTII